MSFFRRTHAPVTTPAETQPADAPATVMTPAAPDWRTDTITSFPAITDQPAPAEAPAPCKCGDPRCPDAPPVPAVPDVRVVLAYGPGVVSRMWRHRVGTGEWENIHAAAAEAGARVHQPAVRARQRIRAQVATRIHDEAAVFAADRDALSDPAISAGLASLADRLHRIQGELFRESAERRERAARAWAEHMAAEFGWDETRERTP
jgi:hypothetical protein